MSEDESVHDGSGNVFRDMGMADADERLARAEMARVALDLEIRIQIGPRPAGKPRAGITVEEVGSFRRTA